VPTEDPVSVTLTQGQFTLLKKVRFKRVRVTITATSNPEVGGVLFKTTRTGGGTQVDTFVALEAFLRIIQTVFGATIEASTPEGVASLDVTYVVKTGLDAG
jgi:hypothetical protein